jgi:hypothetical protein
MQSSAVGFRLIKISSTQAIIVPVKGTKSIIVVVGVLLWIMNAFIPLNRKLKTVLTLVVAFIVLLFLLNVARQCDFFSFMNMGNMHMK